MNIKEKMKRRQSSGNTLLLKNTLIPDYKVGYFDTAKWHINMKYPNITI